VLDAGCGEGYLARALAARGAHVTGIDLSPRLIELARGRDPGGGIDYQVGDLSQPRPTEAGRFDAVGSYLVLNDVAGYRGFAATLAASLNPGGRLALALNNPYGAVTDLHVTDYLDTGAVSPIAGYGNPASRCTTITGLWRITSTRSTRAVSTSPSSPTSSLEPTPTVRRLVNRQPLSEHPLALPGQKRPRDRRVARRVADPRGAEVDDGTQPPGGVEEQVPRVAVEPRSHRYSFSTCPT
jgi:SAM-dependent methyltransferase